MALALTWVFLLFASCSDDAALVGFRKEPRLDTRYVEIPLDFGVFLEEPILTQNIPEDEISRLLVGRISDPDIGTLEAKAYFNFSPPIANVFPSAGATFVSFQLQLKFDFYSIGVMDSSDLKLEVHEIAEQLTPEHAYYSGTEVAIEPTSVGDTIITVGPQTLRNGWEAFVDTDATNNQFMIINILLPGTAAGQNLLEDFKNNHDIFDSFDEFSSKYPGFAVTMPMGNKILGFTPVYSLPAPTSSDSKLILIYKEVTGENVIVDFPIYYTNIFNAGLNVLSPVVSFTNLMPDRSTGALNGIAPFEDFKPSDGKMHIQCGTGIMGKFDLTKFYEHFDTLTNVVINSAELELDNTYDGRAPQKFQLIILDSSNHYRPYTIDTVISATPVRIIDPYFSQIKSGIVPISVGTDETRVLLFDDLYNGNIVVDQEDGSIGRTIFSEFFQQLVIHKSHPRRAKAIALHPSDNEIKKTVSQMKFDASSAKLKIYYSVPLTNLP